MMARISAFKDVLTRTIHEYLLRHPTRRSKPLCDVPILSPTGSFSFGLLDRLHVRLRRPDLRKAPAGLGLKRLATAFMCNPGKGSSGYFYVPPMRGAWVWCGAIGHLMLGGSAV